MAVARPATIALWLLGDRSEEHTSELQSHLNLVCRLLLEKKKKRLIANQQLRRVCGGALGEQPGVLDVGWNGRERVSRGRTQSVEHAVFCKSPRGGASVAA